MQFLKLKTPRAIVLAALRLIGMASAPLVAAVLPLWARHPALIGLARVLPLVGKEVNI